MARRRRSLRAGVLYHVLNRSAKRAPLFWTEEDYAAFERLIGEAKQRFQVNILAYVLMPNHWHFLLMPTRDGELSRCMHWLTTTHSRRWNVAHKKSGTGAVYQGRFKAIPIQDTEHAFKVCRYIERNARRANLVLRAEQWKWCSLASRLNGNSTLLDPLPFALPADWVEIVNDVQTPAEVEAIRKATRTGTAYGHPASRTETGPAPGKAVGRKGRPRRRRDAYENRKNGV